MILTMKYVLPSNECDYFNVTFESRMTKEELSLLIKTSKSGAVNVKPLSKKSK